MKYLIDTNVLIWFIEEKKKLPENISKIIQDNNNELYFMEHFI